MDSFVHILFYCVTLGIIVIQIAIKLKKMENKLIEIEKKVDENELLLWLGRIIDLEKRF